MVSLSFAIGISCTFLAASIALASEWSSVREQFIDIDHLSRIKYGYDLLQSGETLRPQDAGFEEIIALLEESDRVEIPEGTPTHIEASRPIKGQSRRLTIQTKESKTEINRMRYNKQINNESKSSLSVISDHIGCVESRADKRFRIAEVFFILSGTVLLSV